MADEAGSYNIFYEQCSVGLFINSKCHMTTYSSKKDILSATTLSDKQKELLVWRLQGLILTADSTVCLHHYFFYTQYFENSFRKCCDPSKCHRRVVRSDLHSITLYYAKETKKKTGIILVPGQKLCGNCRKHLLDINEDDEIADDYSVCALLHTPVKEARGDSPLVDKEDLDSSMMNIGVSPIKLKSLSKRSKLKYAKRKVNEVKSQVKTKVSHLLKLPEGQLESDSTEESLSSLKKKAKDLDYLVDKIKEKLSLCTKRGKLQILTITPQSWSRQKIATEFKVSEYMARKARQLSATKGILALPEPLEGRKIEAEVEEKVRDFYEDEEYSRLMPGTKDKISIAKNVHVQKHLLLCNLEELYSAFKEKYPLLKIGISKFCQLRPKWCVTVSQPGTHSVCVCCIHQNPLLLLSAMNLDKSKLNDLIDMLVYDKNKRECMFRMCDACPSSENLEEFIRNIFMDFDDEDEVRFCQWVATDRSQLQTMLLPLSEFINLVVQKLEALIPHSFISKHQTQYVKHRKENLLPTEMLILMDFAENYGFILQDEIQSYHWSHVACTVHPVVLYYRKDGEICEKSLCFLSDYMKHDVNFVYEVQRRVNQYITERYSGVNKIEYITDGSAAQYKNYKSLINLCYHQEDFGIDASWSFHATSHGKSACDGVGGSVKRTVTRANLQRPYKDQICTPYQMFDFCNEQFSKVTFQFIKEQDITALESQLNLRFSEHRTVPGTRSYHFFMPLSKTKIAAKRTSADVSFSLNYNFSQQVELPDLQINSYISCVYEDKCYIGFILELDEENEDAFIKFMHPHWPSSLFYWPENKDNGREDKCWVPLVNILCVVDIPEASTQVGRVLYKLTPKCVSDIEAKFTRND